MGSDSRSHLNKSAQRRFLWGVLIVSLLLLGAAVPLIVNPELRLELAHRFGLAPGEDIEQLAGEGDDLQLITVPIEIQRERNVPQYRFRALYLAQPSGGGTELTSIDSGASLTIPLDSLDFIAASPDAAYLLFRDSGGGNTGAVLLEVATGTVMPMPSAESVPEIPGNWEEPIWAKSMGSCNGFSPNAKYIACFQNPQLASFLAGDWEIQVRVYGDAEQAAPVYRGIGFRPYIGWSGDDRWLYFQNEQGLWRAEVHPAMFSMNKPGVVGFVRNVSHGPVVSQMCNSCVFPLVVAWKKG
ncbi:MAG: hypothetical protein AVDCRST_MAG43-1173 [uncultured Thermomicrobiales bacterium]|uniref:Uncharacterized protein n=1 Tax=uncultured Thermomicrobiales bacterium TaxID=1645740 RepID=A0A6J4UJH6_9BACT|nr:MAG: hypothetical protein AVDCRST_MAG43-1173 [uncultured Thermomicrobiales bacterium]